MITNIDFGCYNLLLKNQIMLREISKREGVNQWQSMTEQQININTASFQVFRVKVSYSTTAPLPPLMEYWIPH